MTYAQKRRWILLQAFLETDEEYREQLQKTVEAEDLLLSLRQELTREQYNAVEKITAAYMSLANHTAEAACKYMIFSSEQA